MISKYLMDGVTLQYNHGCGCDMLLVPDEDEVERGAAGVRHCAGHHPLQPGHADTHMVILTIF